MLIDSGVPKIFWDEVVNTASYLINRCMIRSFLNKTPYELLNGRKPKLTYLRTFRCKCFVLNNDGEHSKVHGEVIDMINGKADLMSHVKESSEEDAAETPTDSEEHGPSITATEAENRVSDTMQGTPDAEKRSGTHTSMDTNNGSKIAEPDSSHHETQVSNWKHKCSHPLQNVITHLDSGTQTRSKTRSMFDFSAFLSQIEPKNIKKALKDADWIVSTQDELHQFERNSVWHLVR
ncbi:uncharacterized protein [Nicotiana tomentosiformis]|uniref:uncharacterized protein n=1 Tax=Nicotiana tomentosiformis TaxID=4098 RepID=UPI00388CB220